MAAFIVEKKQAVARFIDVKKKAFQDKRDAKAAKEALEADIAEANFRTLQAQARTALAKAIAAEAEADAAEAMTAIAVQASGKKVHEAHVERIAKQRQIQQEMEASLRAYTEELAAELRMRGIDLPKAIAPKEKFHVVVNTVYETPQERADREKDEAEFARSYHC